MGLIIICISLLIIIFSYYYIDMMYNYLRKIKIINVKHNNRVYVKYPQAPGPKPWPIIGNLALLARYQVPFEGFSDLATSFGDAFSLTLGTTRCLVVNNLELIREVLNQNGKFFGGRPDFIRYHKLFGGNRNNSLALCDWSQLQQKRRNLARRHCSPRESTSYYAKMSDVAQLEATEFLHKLNKDISEGVPFEIKPLLQQTCANMFLQYMCSQRFDYDDEEFLNIVCYFDEIFWEINQGYALDFLPWLSPFYKKHIDKLLNWSKTIRNFILARIINQRERNLDIDEPERDFTDALLKSLIEDKNVDRETIMFMLEDFIGGHSAVGNLVLITLAYVVKYPNVCKRIQSEADRVMQNSPKTNFNFKHITDMPYTMATIYEVLRYCSSPIVPHVATENTVVAGYGVAKGTIVFINNYKLNTSSYYWQNPTEFQPERFLENTTSSTTNIKQMNNLKKQQHNRRRNSEGSDSGVEFVDKELYLKSINSMSAHKEEEQTTTTEQHELKMKKNIPHFLPFSIGKRTCIGQNLVRGFGFILLANILHKYDISCHDPTTIKITPASVALPTKTFSLIFKKRNI